MNSKETGVLLIGTIVTGLASIFGSNARPTDAWMFFSGIAIIAVGIAMLAARWCGAGRRR